MLRCNCKKHPRFLIYFSSIISYSPVYAPIINIFTSLMWQKECRKLNIFNVKRDVASLSNIPLFLNFKRLFSFSFLYPHFVISRLLVLLVIALPFLQTPHCKTQAQYSHEHLHCLDHALREPNAIAVAYPVRLQSICPEQWLRQA